ncbi:MAG: HpcH/HpaI aldolase/citrate lyase family protein [Acidimicrobiales bacterium]
MYVPGDRPDRFDTALLSGADSVIIDLEDSVAEEAKADARARAVAWLNGQDEPAVWIRVNNRPDLLADDLDALRSVSCLGVVIPKATVESCMRTELQVVALIESAAGVTQLRELAALPNVQRLALGEADLAADLGFHPSRKGREFDAIRSQIVVESAAAGLVPPAGPVHTDLRDTKGLRKSSERLFRRGFGGRSVIHPDQVPIVHDAFRPSAEELAWALRVRDSIADGRSGESVMAVVDGEFVDAAVIRRADAILEIGDER